MPTPITYSTVEHQIEKLKSQNLTIEHIDVAKEALNTIGYSSLIKSYREPYIYRENGNVRYRDGVSFEQLISLYLLDKHLRSAVISSMLDLEEHIKALSGEVIASKFGTATSDYLNYRNYRNKRKRQHRFTLSALLSKFQEILLSEKDPIHYCIQRHGDVPPWILFKGAYFSTIVNFIDQFKEPEQMTLVSKLYNSDNVPLSSDALRHLMLDTLFVCLEYRNLAAHGGRIYNYVSNYPFHVSQIWGEQLPSDLSGFNTLLYLLRLLNYGSPYITIADTLESQINRHCKLFPADVTYLGSILNVNITTHNIVYLPKGGRIYHKDPHCCGIKNAETLELSEAVSLGLKACCKCTN